MNRLLALILPARAMRWGVLTRKWDASEALLKELRRVNKLMGF